jgi:hypothetical protein
MITLIDRADGTALCTLSAEDFVVLQDNLVQESEQDFDYYFNDGTLELLAGAGMSEEVVAAISSRMRYAGVDLGWEAPSEEGSRAISGTVVDTTGKPLGGIRVDLVSEEAILTWAYSRTDGRFTLLTSASDPTMYMRFSGRGDLVLRQVQVQGEGDQGNFELQTMKGSVQTEDNKPLAGVNVMLADWRSPEQRDTTSWAALGGQRSWGDTDVEGRFSIPVHLPEDVGPLEVELELTTLGGQTLETVVLTLGPESGWDVGVLRAPEPALVEQQEEQELAESSAE